MIRVNITLTDVAAAQLDALGEYYGISDRSSLIRFLAAKESRELGITKEEGATYR